MTLSAISSRSRRGSHAVKYLDGASTSPAEGVSERYSTLPSGKVCCLVKPPAGPVQRVTTLRQPDRDALRAGPPTTSRHYGVGPSTTVGAAIRVTEHPPYRRVPSGSLGLGGLGRREPGTTTWLYSHDPRHVASAVPRCLSGSDGHGAGSSGG